jgi:phosphatidylethanolamine/phosphatidyl-N-methylethanolamine N-methyltransferase
VTAPARPLNTDHVRSAYRRWSGVYDAAFGGVSAAARRHTVAAINALPGTRVLEMGVGTGLALPLYAADRRVTGIDLSAEMLAHARKRAADLPQVEALLEADATATGLPSASFDVAAAMFVASVVPDPRALLAEMRRVLRPGGTLVFVNHFARERGALAVVERAAAPLSRALGWHPDFRMEALLSPAERLQARCTPMPPAGLFTLVLLPT